MNPLSAEGSWELGPQLQSHCIFIRQLPNDYRPYSSCLKALRQSQTCGFKALERTFADNSKNQTSVAEEVCNQPYLGNLFIFVKIQREFENNLSLITWNMKCIVPLELELCEDIIYAGWYNKNDHAIFTA